VPGFALHMHQLAYRFIFHNIILAFSVFLDRHHKALIRNPLFWPFGRILVSGPSESNTFILL
jgi:hypothetical protein